MKLKNVRIVVEPLAKTNQRWVKALKGQSKSSVRVYTLSVASWEVLGRILSPPRLQILALVPVLKPKSISALAKAMKKDFKNVYSDVRFLADLGLLELKSAGGRKPVVPVPVVGGLELSLSP